jgi:hypothetical protein
MLGFEISVFEVSKLKGLITTLFEKNYCKQYYNMKTCGALTNLKELILKEM